MVTPRLERTQGRVLKFFTATNAIISRGLIGKQNDECRRQKFNASRGRSLRLLIWPAPVLRRGSERRRAQAAIFMGGQVLRQGGKLPISRRDNEVFIGSMLAKEIVAVPGEHLPEIKLLPRAAKPPVNLLAVPFDNVTFHESLDRIQEMIWSRQPHYVATANVDFVVRARRDPRFRRALLGAHLILCDGTPLIWASRIFRNPLPERVAGSDLVPELLKLAAQNNYRLFFLGTTPEACAQAAANVRKQFPGIVVDCFSPPFRPLHEMDNDEIIRRIHAAQPDIVLVAFGSPKAEKWMQLNYRAVNVPVMIGVGGTIDFLAGHLKRAPRWMRRNGLEWAFRLLQEPRRLFKRYLTDLWHFGIAIAKEFLKVKSASSSSSFSSSNLIYEEDEEQEKDCGL